MHEPLNIVYSNNAEKEEKMFHYVHPSHSFGSTSADEMYQLKLTVCFTVEKKTWTRHDKYFKVSTSKGCYSVFTSSLAGFSPTLQDFAPSLLLV